MLNLQITNPKIEKQFNKIINFFNGNIEKALLDMIDLENKKLSSKPVPDWKKDFLSASVWTEENEKRIKDLRQEMRNWKIREF